MVCAERTSLCEYVEALEEERRKIQVFQRELPLCLQLVIHAIDACKKELSGTTGRSDCSEQTSSDAPVLEEFIPIKRIGCEEAEAEDDEDVDDDRSSKEKDHKRKSDWLRSVQLWNQSPDTSSPPQKEEVPRKATVTEVKRNGTGGAFQPFQRDKGKTLSSNGKKNGKGDGDASTSSSAETVGSRGGTTGTEDKDAGGQRKQRRCWSPELHRRFVLALQQLGGSHAGTPKQIRELMKVDGLTNDEVKSHLQKYRLHTRRPSPTVHNSRNPQAPQFLVVGGIWVAPPEFGATTGDAATSSSNGIYAPVATTPALRPPRSATVRKGGHVVCNSPATSSSTHTTTTSPVY